MKRESYEMLGLPRNATEREIKTAYRRLARQYHPDVSDGTPEAAARFREINEAYQRLSGLGRREGARGYDGAEFRGGAFNLGDLFGEGGLGDIFGFGANAGATWWPDPVPGADHEVDLTIPLEDALRGTTRRLIVRVQRRCEACSGRGSLDGQIGTCGQCDGQGALPGGRANLEMPFRERVDCPACRARGVVFENPCMGCHGAGRVVGSRTVDLPLPPGRAGEMPIRLRGQGHDGEAGGVAGDLYVRVRLTRHPLFEVRGDDVCSDVEIRMQEALFGGTITVATLDGPRKVRLRPGAPDQELYRLKEFGLPRADGAGRGDQLIRFRATLPGGLEGEKADLLRDLLSIVRDRDVPTDD